MKTSFLFTFILSMALLPGLWANSTAVNSTQFCLHNQLTSQNWESEDGTLWQFNADGTLWQLNAAEQQVAVGQWALQTADDKAILQVKLSTDQVYWSLEDDCRAASLQLLNGTEQTLEIHTRPSKSISLDWFIGDWQEGVHANHPVLTFAADGTYQRLCRAEGDLELTTGHWMISRDGSTILMYRPEGQLEAFALKYLNMDEMVIRAYRPGANDCFLNKM